MTFATVILVVIGKGTPKGVPFFIRNYGPGVLPFRPGPYMSEPQRVRIVPGVVNWFLPKHEKMEQSHHNSLEYVVAVLHSGKCKNGYCRVEARSIETNEPVLHRPGPHWLVPARAILQAFAKERGVPVLTVEPDIKWFHGTGHRTGKYQICAVVGFKWADGEQDILEMFLVDQNTIEMQGLRRIELTGIPMFADTPTRGRADGQ